MCEKKKKKVPSGNIFIYLFYYFCGDIQHLFAVWCQMLGPDLAGRLRKRMNFFKQFFLLLNLMTKRKLVQQWYLNKTKYMYKKKKNK